MTPSPQALIALMLWIATAGLFTLAIWTGDFRYTQTAFVTGVPAIVTGIIWLCSNAPPLPDDDLDAGIKRVQEELARLRESY